MERIEIAGSLQELDQNSAKNKKQKELLSMYVDQKHVNQKGSFYNYGVRHNAEFFKLQRNKILELIQNNDIIALERSDGYFLDLARYAKEQGKEVYCIDGRNKSTNIIAKLNTFLSSSLALANIVMHEEILEAKKIRWLLKTLLAHTLSATSLYPESFLILNTKDQQYVAKNDISYTIDGRTVLMTENVQQLIQQYPNQNIVAITGNIHAQGIEYYLANENIFKKRLEFYNIVYAPLSSQLEIYE